MMQFVRFLVGILVAQAATFVLFWLEGVRLEAGSALRIAVASLFVAVAVAFWFGALARAIGAAERERWRLYAEREKGRAHRKAQRQIMRESRKAQTGANFKIAAAFTGVVALGIFFMMAQMVTTGMLLLVAGSATAGGYYLRMRRERTKSPPVQLSDAPKRITRKKG